MNEFLGKLLSTILGLSLWYGIFVFITLEPNPLNWAMWVRVLTVIFSISVISSNLND